MKAAIEFIHQNENVKRNIPQQGIMVKAAGIHSAGGHTYHSQIREKTIHSKNPRDETVKKIQDQHQIRCQLKDQEPLIQMGDFEFLLGILPHLALQQFKKAHTCGLLNILGRPKTSSFATFAYCAGSHHSEKTLNGNIIPVTRKSHAELRLQLDRFQSNFVYPGFRVIVELAEDAHWIWHADVNDHGTTANALAVQNPQHWKQYATLDSDAQWTLVSTIPSAVADAAVHDNFY
ncbi:hypothetical protein JAAARDRAFT_199548 [Jaapia argillacea MUCL 33604]|uniref:Uncharacterized protein n=1 Tax=Jaapia argillacea MUCL 33604 TaxID=933084 RepID=A0A067P7Z3_9AGAM|nr:hypothetical protein JAAARDRAFT_199548 [Jaapia argillacea MUCL 33604]